MGLCSPLPAMLAYLAVCKKAPSVPVGTQTLCSSRLCESFGTQANYKKVSLESLTPVSLLRTQENSTLWGVNATMLLDYTVLSALEMKVLEPVAFSRNQGVFWHFKLQIKHFTNTRWFILPDLLCHKEVMQKQNFTQHESVSTPQHSILLSMQISTFLSKKYQYL